jgi:uncharacterized membrane protein
VTRNFRIGGYVAGIVLVAIGIACIVIGLVGRADVHDRLAQEKIVGTPDSSIAGETVDSGSDATEFADTIRKHTLEATGGLTYAEMPRAVYKSTGKAVPEDKVDAALASGKAIDNPEREIWITSTALSTALNTSFFAESVATFTIVVGFALILIGIGLLVLTRGVARTETRPGTTATPG